jgi:hypothetical protein
VVVTRQSADITGLTLTFACSSTSQCTGSTPVAGVTYVTDTFIYTPTGVFPFYVDLLTLSVTTAASSSVACQVGTNTTTKITATATTITYQVNPIPIDASPTTANLWVFSLVQGQTSATTMQRTIDVL